MAGAAARADRGRGACRPAPGTAVPLASGGVSSSANTRSAATVAACMTENLADASRIGR